MDDESKADFVKRLGITMTHEWSDVHIPFTTNRGIVWKCVFKRKGHRFTFYYGTGLYYPEADVTVAHVLQYLAECETDTLYDARESWHAVCRTHEDHLEADRYLDWFQNVWKRLERFFGEYWNDYRKVYCE